MKLSKLILSILLFCCVSAAFCQAPPPPPPTTTNWTGAVNSDWNNGANWTAGVPSASMDALILIGAQIYPVISGPANTVRDMIVNENTSVTIAANAIVRVYGDWTNFGSQDIGTGTVYLFKSAAGLISGNTTFNTLNICGNYSVGSSGTDKISVTGLLNKVSGTLTTSDKVTLLSDPNRTAIIAENGGILSGNVTVQCYVGGVSGFHHISSPVFGSVGSLSGFTIFGTNGVPSTSGPSPGTLEEYIEQSNNTSSLANGYYNYTSQSDALVTARGYSAMTVTTSSVIEFFGAPHTGNNTVSITKAGTNGATSGWNLIGNPYPSPMSWTALKTANPGVMNGTCYMWRPTGVNTGQWQAFNGIAGINGVGDIIASGQGFFIIKSHAGTSALTFTNAMRTQAQYAVFFKTNTAQPDEIRLSISSTTDPGSEAVAYTQAGAGDNSDADAVMPPLMDGISSPTIAYATQGQKYLIHTTDAINENTILPLAIHTGAAGTYTISAAALNVADLPAYLYDNATNTYYDLSSDHMTWMSPGNEEINGRYSVVFSKKDNDQTAGQNNVNIFGKTGAVVVERTIAGAPAQVSITDLLGRQVMNTTVTGNTAELPVEATNAIYLVSVRDSGTETIKKVFVR